MQHAVTLRTRSANVAAPPRVCALAYDGLCTFEFGIVVEVFGLARPELELPWYRFEVVAERPGPLCAVGGVSINVPDTQRLDRLRRADLILIPGWRGADRPVPAPLCRALAAAQRRGARIASICSGAFVLAAAGLLRGRRAATHWRYADALRAAEPSAEVDDTVLYIDDGDVLSSAGSAAGLDLCLHIVRADYGPAVANAVARRLVLPAHRDGGQAQFVPRPVADRGGGIAPLLDALRRRLDRPWTVASMASHAHVSPRTLQRRFRDATGCSPQLWLTGERVGLARELLETTALGVDTIAERCGFATPETLRYHFRRRLGVSPRAYRAAFSLRGGATAIRHPNQPPTAREERR